MPVMAWRSRERRLGTSRQRLLVLAIALFFFLVTGQAHPAEALSLELGLANLVNIGVDLAEEDSLLGVTANVDTGDALSLLDTDASVGLGVGGPSILDVETDVQTSLPGGQDSGGAGLSVGLTAVDSDSSSLLDACAGLDANVAGLPILESRLPNTNLSTGLEAGASVSDDGFNASIGASADVGLQAALPLASGLGVDAGVDTGFDLGLDDSGLDVSLDAGASLAAEVETPLVGTAADAGLDAGFDVGLSGGGLDDGLDAGVDLGIDGEDGSGISLDDETESADTAGETRNYGETHNGSQISHKGQTGNNEDNGSSKSQQPDNEYFQVNPGKQTRDRYRDSNRNGSVGSPSGEKPDPCLAGLRINITSLASNKVNPAAAVPAGHDNAHRFPDVPCPSVPSTAAVPAAGSITAASSPAGGSKGWAVLADALAAVPPLPSGWLPDAARYRYSSPGMSPSALPG